MKKSEMRSALERLNQRLDNQWAYARSDADEKISSGWFRFDDEGNRRLTEPASATAPWQCATLV